MEGRWEGWKIRLLLWVIALPLRRRCIGVGWGCMRDRRCSAYGLGSMMRGVVVAVIIVVGILIMDQGHGVVTVGYLFLSAWRLNTMGASKSRSVRMARAPNDKPLAKQMTYPMLAFGRVGRRYGKRRTTAFPFHIRASLPGITINPILLAATNSAAFLSSLFPSPIKCEIVKSSIVPLTTH